MKQSNSRQWGEWAVVLAVLGVVATVFQQIATSLTEQDAASGDAFSNSALFPALVAKLLMVLLALQVIVLIKNQLSNTAVVEAAAAEEIPESPAQRLKMVFSLVALVVLYLLALVPLGFHISTAVVMTAMFLVLGTRPFAWALVAGVGTTLLFAVVFELMLKVVLPVGMFEISLSMFWGR